MFFKLFAMMGWIDQGHKRAARTAREAFSATRPHEPVSWTEIAAEEPGHFVVGVHYGHGRPKKCQFYSVDKESFKVTEITDRS